VEQAQVLPWGSMTISIGVCDVRQVTDLESWFRFADAALYNAKDLGRNRVELAEPTTLAPGSERAHWRTFAGRR
jgi:hypothetical protein